MFELSAQLPRRNEFNRTICARYAPNTSHKNTHMHTAYTQPYIDAYSLQPYCWLSEQLDTFRSAKLKLRRRRRGSGGQSFSSHWHCAIKLYMKCAIIVRSRSANLLAQDVRHIIITVLVISYKTDTHT